MKLIRNICLATLAATALNASAGLDLPVKSVNGTDYYYYEVKPKESIYSLVKKLGVSRDDIMRHNPSAIDGLRAKQVLLFPVSEFADGPAPKTVKGVPVEVCPEEQAPAEPLPVEVPATPLVPATPVTIDTVEEEDADDDDAQADSSLNVAVVLPFMLDSERPSKQAESYTEFYRGLLMAVDTVAGKDPDMKITVSAFDSEGSSDRVASLLSDPALRAATYIIAPDDSVSIELLADMADTTGATVVNLFSVKNDAQVRHPSVYQANIPHDMMYDKALDAFIANFGDYTPVLLTATDITADKQRFVTELAARLDRLGRRYETVDFAGDLDEKILSPEHFPADERFIFVPASGSREMMTRILVPLIDLRGRADVPDNIRLFGYPEWIIVRGEQARKLHELDTAIYSRFATDTDSYPTRLLGMRYEDWFGSKMANAAPVYGMLGYDTGRWMLADGQSYTGLQNSFEPGSVNTALYFVYFAPDGKIRVKAL